jgi:hypothetical protein
MATGATRLADVIVPEIFDPYMQNITEEKTAIINSGAVVNDSAISAHLAGGGLTFNTPSWRDLANDDEDIMTDDYDDQYGHPTFGVSAPYAGTLGNSIPKKTGSLMEVSVRMMRHQSWTSVELAGVLAGSDPQESIAQRVGAYWARRRQAAFVALMKGVFADNAAAPVGSEHVQNDLTFDASGSIFQAGLTDFNAVNFLRACLTMGDSQNDLGMVLMHSIVYHKAQVNNLIDFRPDATNPDAEDVPFFLGRRVIVDDGMPTTDGKVFETWLFGAGAVRFGTGPVSLPSETERHARAGAGAGQDVLHTRVCWCFHPVGHKYNGTAPNGGPSNAATANNLAHADSWQRVFPERKQIKIARLITRESA